MLTICMLILTQPPGWHQYQSDDKKLTLHYPRKPTVNAKQQQMAQGDTTVTSVGLPRTQPGENSMVLTWYDVKKGKKGAELQTYLQGVEKGTVQGRQATALSSKEAQFNGQTGRDFTYEAKGVFYRTKLFLFSQRFVSLTYLANSEAELTGKEAKQFFDSLKVKD